MNNNNKKYSIELNGVANLLILLDNVEEEMCTITESQVVDMKEMRKQLDTLHRYMIAYNKAINSQTDVPKWHEVRESPSKYPNNH